MYKINIQKPAHDANFDAIKKYRHKDVRNALESMKVDLLGAFSEYTDNAAGNNLRKQNHLYAYDKVWTEKSGEAKPLGNIIHDCYSAGLKMLSDYENKLIYNCGYIKGVCPVCGASTTSMDWDHYAPRSKYPELSLLYSNLVPVCHRCNDKKSDYWPVKADDGELYNAYYGTKPSQKILNCTITVDDKGFINAEVSLSGVPLPDEATKTALFTIEKLDLLDIYTDSANKQLRTYYKNAIRHKQDSSKAFDNFWKVEEMEFRSIIRHETDVNDIARIVCEAILKDDTFKDFVKSN